jgi:hypothetical protein
LKSTLEPGPYCSICKWLKTGLIVVEGVPHPGVFLDVLRIKGVAADGSVSVESTGLKAVQNEHLRDFVSAESRGLTARELGSM